MVFFLVLIKTYIVGTRKNRLTEMFSMKFSIFTDEKIYLYCIGKFAK